MLALLTLTLLGILALGFLVFALAPERAENRAFAAFQWLAALWVANDLAFWCFHGPETSGRPWARAAFLIAIGLQLSFLRFAWMFPRPRPIPAGVQAAVLAPLLVLVPVILVGDPIGETGFEGGAFALRLTPWTFIIGVYVYGAFGLGRWIVVHKRRAKADAEETRRQLGTVVVAPALTGVMTTVAIVVLPLLGVYTLLPWVSLAILAGSLLYAYSIFNLRFLRPEAGVLDRVRLYPVSAKLALAVAGFWALGVAVTLLTARVAIGDVGAAAWQQATVFGITAAALPAMGLILVAQRILTRPLRRLTEAALQVAGGRTDVRVELPQRGDEVSVLAEAFNEMVARLEQDIQAQRETSEGILRTERLAIAGSLAAGVAHEVNNPLAAVSSLVQLSRERSGDEQTRELLDEAIAQVERISTSLRELMDFARPPARARQPCDLDQVVEATARLLRYDKRFRRIEIALEPSSDPARVEGDPDQLRQVLLNLLLNARDAVQELEQPRVVVATRRAGAEVELTVADNGPGIPAAARDALFEAFYTTKPPGEGTGLGLAVCRDLVREHGGRISLESEPGEGARFRIALPALEETP